MKETKTKDILIWGTALRGKEAYNVLKAYNFINIVGFGDNDIEKCGLEYCGKKIFAAFDLDKIEKLDGIVIASSYSDDIYQQLKELIQVPIYSNVWELLYKRASIDISGYCNAHCKWCATGIRNRTECNIVQKYMSLQKFEVIYNHMIEKSIINRFSEILLYSWGEPFLNPDYIKIVEYLSENQQVFSMSTNASVVAVSQEINAYKYCKSFTFSMPGFSQNSYNIIHGFNFERIKDNISKILNNLKSCGFEGEAILSYHVYQFNQSEIKSAKEFADLLGLTFVPVYAYFAGYGLTRQYLANEMSYDMLKEAGKDLILHHVDKLLMDRPENFQCMVENMISINTEGNIEICCCCDSGVKDYEWGNILLLNGYLDWKELRKKMLVCETCIQCRESKIDYWFFNNPDYVIS